MSNPRKFSEKIALHTQKQAEGTAAFEAILREVSATTKVSVCKNDALGEHTRRKIYKMNKERLYYKMCSAHFL